MRTQREIENNSYHEAGHAIAAVVLGQKFKCATVKRRESSWGRLEGFNGGHPIFSAIVYFSGPLAQSKLGCEILECDGNGDFDNARAQLDWLCVVVVEIDNKKLYNDTMKCARQFVEDNFKQIECIAHVLIDKKRLEYSEIIKLLVENKMYCSLVIPKMPRLEKE